MSSFFCFRRGFTGAGGHNTVKFVVLGEVVCEGQDHVPEEDQALAGARIADMRRLLGGDIQPLAEDFPVPARLVQKIDKITVFKNVLDLRGG